MAVLDRFNKQPDEVKKYQIDYSAWLSTGVAISSSSQVITILNPASSDVGEPTLTISATAIIANGTGYQYYISGGTDGKRYKVTFLTNTADSQTLESEIEFTVSDV
jgi:hypothetical protein